MTELLSYWFPLTVLLAIAKRWTDLDPLAIENGPRWPRAFVQAGKSTLLLKLGFVMLAAGHQHLPSYFAEAGFGAGVGSAFCTFDEDRDRNEGAFLVWYKSRWNDVADSWFAMIFVAALTWIGWWVFGVDVRFWITLALALFLLQGRFNLAVISVNDPEKDKQLAKRQALLGGNVVLTAAVGTLAFVVWMFQANSLISVIHDPADADLKWQIAGFLVGILLSFL